MAGDGVDNVAKQAAAVKGVSKVLTANNKVNLITYELKHDLDQFGPTGSFKCSG